MSPKKRLALEVALLAAQGLNQKEIAARLRVDQSTVSRRMADARYFKYIEIPEPLPILKTDNIPDELLKQVQGSVEIEPLRRVLLDRLGSLSEKSVLHNIQIERSIGQLHSEKDWLHHLRLVCRAGAAWLADKLPRARVLGVSWGYTLRLVLDELESKGIRAYRNNVTVFPTAGSFPYLDKPYPVYLTSSALARDMATYLNRGLPPDQISLAAVPAYIPINFEDEREALERFFGVLPSYRHIFGDNDSLLTDIQSAHATASPLVEQADTMITGLGDMPEKEGEGSPSLTERLRLEGASVTEWSRLAAGDIGGMLIPRQGASVEQVAEVDEINNRFIGLRLEHFQRCASCSAKSGGKKPGVLAIAHGVSKAEIALEVVRNNCVNELVIDSNLGQKLKVLLENEPGTARSRHKL